MEPCGDGRRHRHGAAIIQAAGPHLGRVIRRFIHLVPVLEETIQRLGHASELLKGGAQLVIPMHPQAQEIVRLHHFPAAGGAAGANEGFARVEGAIVVGEFLAGLDIAHGDFEFIAGSQTIRLAGVVHKTGEIPAEDKPALGIDETVFLKDRMIHRPKTGQFVGGKSLVKVIPYPGDGSPGNAPGGEDAVANVIVYETKFSIWMEHARCNFHPCSRDWGKRYYFFTLHLSGGLVGFGRVFPAGPERAGEWRGDVPFMDASGSRCSRRGQTFPDPGIIKRMAG